MAYVSDSASGVNFGWVDGEDNWGSAVNQTLQRLAYRGLCVSIKDILATPPSSPLPGDKYIIDPAPTGAWSSFRRYSIVVWGADAQGSQDSSVPPQTVYAWREFTAQLGWLVYNEGSTDADRSQKVLVYTGASDGWSVVGGAADALTTVTSDATITGDGSATPLGVATPFTADEKAKLSGLAANRQLPSGGTQYQILEKTANTDYSVGWVDAPTTPLPNWESVSTSISGTLAPGPTSRAGVDHPIMVTRLNTDLTKLFNADRDSAYPFTVCPMLGLYIRIIPSPLTIALPGDDVVTSTSVRYVPGNNEIVSSPRLRPDAGSYQTEFLPLYSVTTIPGLPVGSWVTSFSVVLTIISRGPSAFSFSYTAQAYAGVFHVPRNSSRGARSSTTIGTVDSTGRILQVEYSREISGETFS